MRRFLLLFMGWLLSFAAMALPEQFLATYTVTSRAITLGRAEWSLKPVGEGRYRYEAVTAPVGVAALFYKSGRTEHSEWRYYGDGIRPLSYSYDRGGSKARRVEISFDWQRGVATNTINGDNWRMPIAPGTLDKNVYVLALMRDLEQGKRDVTYSIADGGRIKNYRFSLQGSESLETALGPLATLRMQRVREAATRQTTFWCAPKLDYLPVQVVHREKDGTIVTLRISAFER